MLNQNQMDIKQNQSKILKNQQSLEKNIRNDWENENILLIERLLIKYIIKIQNNIFIDLNKELELSF